MRHEKDSLSDKILENIRRAGVIGNISVRQLFSPGVVCLSGVVLAPRDRVRADEIARSTSGVLEVNNELISDHETYLNHRTS